MNEEKAIQNLASQLSPEMFGSVLDRTLLEPNASWQEFDKLCLDANKSGSYVCISPDAQDRVYEFIRERKLNRIRGMAVVGFEFPNGNLKTEDKINGYKVIYERDASDVDGVINHHQVPHMQQDFWSGFETSISRIIESLPRVGCWLKTFKLIFELGAFKNETDKAKAIEIFVSTVRKIQPKINVMFKTGTGFWLDENYRAARREDVRLAASIIGRYDVVKNNIGIKAAGGIKTARQALEFMLDAGVADADGNLLAAARYLPFAFRVGCSADLYKDFIENYNYKK